MSARSSQDHTYWFRISSESSDSDPESHPLFARASAAYDEVSRGVSVKTADDVEQSGLSAAGGTEYRDELTRTEGYIHSAQSRDTFARALIGFCYFLQL